MEELPDQFVNAGVAEQNMTGLAAGMALCGKIVFTYSIANFPTLRCLEHVRNDVCYHEANVKVVSVGGGFAYGSMGATHHATEDLGVMRMPPEHDRRRTRRPGRDDGGHPRARRATRALLSAARQGRRARRPRASRSTSRIGRAIRVRDGGDVTLVSTGGTLQLALTAADALEEDGVSVRVLSMHTLKPLDDDEILDAARETGAIVTIEEHSIVGGLGSAVAELLAESDDVQTGFRRVGAPSRFSPRVGSQQYLLAENGIDVEGIRRAVAELLRPSGRVGATG